VATAARRIEGIFDTATGEFLRQGTHQGWRGDSSWARGLAWALYGFGTATATSGDARFLATAEACARFYIERTRRMACRPTIGTSPRRRSPTRARPRPRREAVCGTWPAWWLKATAAQVYRALQPAHPHHVERPEFLACGHAGLG